MPELPTSAECERLLAESAQEVLETMFFSSVAEASPRDAEAGSARLVEIRFQGNPPGVFRQRLGRPAARELAAAFLGAVSPEDIEEADVENVLREMANVICGRALSRIESDSAFDLGSPVILEETSRLPDGAEAHCQVPLESGVLEIWLALGKPA